MKILFQVPKGNVEDDQSMPVHHLYESRHDNVTSSIQGTVCLELEKYNKTEIIDFCPFSFLPLRIQTLKSSS